MASVNPSVYKSILRVKRARSFDAGGLLMRIYYYMTNIGIISMLTLSGYSFFMAGLVSSTVALSVFLLSPRISMLVDRYGQRRVVPKAACVPVVGTVGMLIVVQMQAPGALLFPCAVLMGCVPSAQALVRARWTYLLRTGKLGDGAPEMRVVFSYEAIIDDICFMISPPLSIFLASTVTPIAGLAVGIACFAVGTWMLSASRDTEPVPGWSADGNAQREAERGAAGEFDIAEGETDSAETALSADVRPKKPKKASVFRTSSVVRVLFFAMFFVGAFFGSLDTSTMSLAESLGDPNIASVALILQALCSVVMGFLFGMVRLTVKQSTQLIMTAVFFGCAFSLTAFIDSAFLLFVITIPASLSYAPFLIMVNATCEQSVPGDRFTEAITWVNAGSTCGMTLGPTLAGMIVDTLGMRASFVIDGALAAMVMVVVLLGFVRIGRTRKRESRF